MQSADDVEFRDRLGPTFRRRAEDFFQRHGVGAVSARLAPESAQLATGHADVGGIDVTVDVEIGEVPVPLFADVVRQMADGKKVVRVKKRDALFKRQPLTGKDFRRNGLQGLIFDLDLTTEHEKYYLNPNLLAVQLPRAGAGLLDLGGTCLG